MFVVVLLCSASVLKVVEVFTWGWHMVTMVKCPQNYTTSGLTLPLGIGKIQFLSILIIIIKYQQTAVDRRFQMLNCQSRKINGTQKWYAYDCICKCVNMLHTHTYIYIHTYWKLVCMFNRYIYRYTYIYIYIYKYVPTYIYIFHSVCVSRCWLQHRP